MANSLKAPLKVFKTKKKVSSCQDIALLPAGGVVVADGAAGAVKLFDDKGEFESNLASRVRPQGVTCSRSGLIAFVNQEGRKGYSVNLRMVDGQEVGSWGKDWIWHPHAISGTNRGRLVLSDLHKHQLQVAVYTQDGRMLHKCHIKNCHPPLGCPLYVDVDVYDRVAVSDRKAHCVHVFDSEGKYLLRLGETQSGSGNGLLRSPLGVTSDAKGNWIVSDCGNRRVSVFSSGGRFIQHLLTKDDGLDYPAAVDYNRQGRLVVANLSSSYGSFTKLRGYDVGAEPQQSASHTIE